MKKILFVIIILFLMPSFVFAKSKTSCNYTLVSNLKKLVSNVNMTYSYRISDGSVYYDITFTNIQPDLYFYDKIYDRYYSYDDTNNGVITLSEYYPGNVSFTFYSRHSECNDEKLSVKSVSLPYYNRYYDDDLCDGIEDYNLCQRWINYNGTYTYFKEQVQNYRYSLISKNDNNDIVIKKSFLTKLIEYFTSYYYIILPLSIMIFVGVLYLIKFIKNRLNRFDI